MLLRLRVRNFLSLRDEVELSLVAGTGSEHPEVPRPLVGLEPGVLPAAVIYGPNASGKTNVLKALRFVRHAVCHSHADWGPNEGTRTQPFSLDDASRTGASFFEVEFAIGDVPYTYGFELDKERIHREWLYAYPSKKRRTWFFREDDGRFYFGKTFGGENRAIAQLTRSNSLFLSAAAQNNHKAILPIYSWFASVAFATDNRADLWRLHNDGLRDDAFRARVLRLLKSADPGVLDVVVREEAFPPEAQRVFDALNKALPTDQAPTLPKTFQLLEFSHATAAGDPQTFPASSESAGTLTLFGLGMMVIRALHDGTLVCVDELDASLHPLLALQLVKLFNDAETNQFCSQLVFTTHDTILLSPQLLRRDQIWFTEKSPEGATSLYPLSDFKPRKDENLQKGYLLGRYGAIPYFEGGVLGGDEDQVD